MVGGEIGKEMCLNLYSMEDSFWTWHPFTRLVSRLENPLVSWSYSFIRLQIGLWSLLLSQYFQDSCRVVNMFKKMFNLKSLLLRQPFLQSLSLLLRRPSLSQSWITFALIYIKSCYLFHVIDVGYIKALLWRVFSCRLQLIIHELDLETNWYLGTCMPQWQVSSLSTMGFHYWPLIGRFHRVFDFNSLIHIRWIVLKYLGNHWH